MKNLISIKHLSFFLFGILFSSSTLFGQNETNQTTVAPDTDKTEYIIQMDGLFEKEHFGMGVGLSVLYMLDHSFGLGGGIGYDAYKAPDKRRFMPITFEMYGALKNKGVTPFYLISVGYGLALGVEDSFGEKARGGVVFNPKIGIKAANKPFEPYISFGYQLQSATYTGQDDYGNDNKQVKFKRWQASLGFMF